MRNRQIDFLTWGHGLFLHFGPYTWFPKYGRKEYMHNENIVPPEQFSPSDLDCTRWADFADSIGTGYCILTARHQDGFCLWPTATDSPASKRDIVCEYVDAMRAKKIRVGLYYSLLDLTGRENETMQITELMTQYGKIDYLFIDGYGCDRKPHDYAAIGKAIRDNQSDIILSNGYMKDSLIFFEGEPDVGWIGNERGIINMPVVYDRTYYNFDKTKKRKLCIIPSAYVRTRTTHWFYTLEPDALKTPEKISALYKIATDNGAAFVVNVGIDRTGNISDDENKLLSSVFN